MMYILDELGETTVRVSNITATSGEAIWLSAASNGLTGYELVYEYGEDYEKLELDQVNDDFIQKKK